MAKNFATIAFTDAVKAMQEKAGSRSGYARMEKANYLEGLTKNEMDFIADRDSFYMASIGENNFPYLQHRGGPRGFIKVLDEKRIGIIDFRGNMQYITVGNISTNHNVALIMVDYPARARLKILARAEVVELMDDPSLYELLDPGDYTFKPERMMVFHIEAYDWNCPQHITPRYTVQEIEEAFEGQRNHIAKLEAEVKSLKMKLNDQ
ncbi:MAG: pyridoxamine 5'-phosphate oxidase family protein [Saprospiraceae bacterium]|nr:pyridoxamine 5'-phosphate oxidase family protein [Saprospiraceae bacterium]